MVNERVKGEFFCNYCLEVTEAEDYPEICPACKVGYCSDCMTRLKAKSKWCYGCGKFSPTIRSRMSRSSSIGGVYVCEGWAWLGLGVKAGQPLEWCYGVSVGWENNETVHTKETIKYKLYREKRDGTKEDVRELTADERTLMGYKE